MVFFTTIFELNHWFKYFHFLCWGIPLFTAIISLIFHAYGKTGSCTYLSNFYNFKIILMEPITIAYRDSLGSACIPHSSNHLELEDVFSIEGPESSPIKGLVQEFIFIDSNTSKIVGDVFGYNSRNQLVPSTKTQAYKGNIEASGKGVGRIFCRQNNEQTDGATINTTFVIGTGIALNEDHIITCYHTNTPSIKYSLLLYHTTIGHEIELDNIEDYDFIYEVEIVKKRESITVEDMFYKSSKWLHTNDLSILKFVSKSPSPMTYCIPFIPQETKDLNLFMIGYPHEISFNNFKQTYHNNCKLEDTISNYSQIKVHFENRILSISPSNGTYTNDKNSLGAHSCPTLVGCSGGIIGCLTGNDCKYPNFSGIHLGGLENDTNLYICLSNPLFLHLYLKYVLTESMILKHKDELFTLLELAKTLNITQ
ncbi:hypothetical protein ACTFIY_001507 [Dictyostelium cf. discoideum]